MAVFIENCAWLHYFLYRKLTPRISRVTILTIPKSQFSPIPSSSILDLPPSSSSSYSICVSHQWSLSLRSPIKCTLVMSRCLRIRVSCSQVDQYSPHTPAVDAHSLRLKWHSQGSPQSTILSLSQVLFTYPRSQPRHSLPMPALPLGWLKTPLPCIARYLSRAA